MGSWRQIPGELCRPLWTSDSRRLPTCPQPGLQTWMLAQSHLSKLPPSHSRNQSSGTDDPVPTAGAVARLPQS